MNIDEMKQTLRDAGIAGCGGAGFPTYAKLTDKIEILILNCAECEPLLKLHRQVLAAYTNDILFALRAIADSVGAKRVIVGVKEAYTRTVEAVRAVIGAYPGVELSLLPEVYPAGDEVMLIYETTGIVIPAGGLPIHKGCAVINVETAFNAARALKEKQPVTHKFVTVAGEVAHPITVRVPIGTAYGDLLAMAGGITGRNCQIFSGGPMTGRLATEFDAVTKTTNAVLVLPNENDVIMKRRLKPSVSMHRAMAACCQCRACTDLCPRHLLGHPIQPHLFMRQATNGITENVEPYLDSMYCCQCGLCEMYACQQDLSPRTLLGLCKGKLRAYGIKATEAEMEPVSPERNERRVPMQRLIAHLGLTPYDVPAPLDPVPREVEKLTVALSQNIGLPGKPVVKTGERVNQGQVIAELDPNKLGVPIHAGISGVIADVNEKTITITR